MPSKAIPECQETCARSLVFMGLPRTGQSAQLPFSDLLGLAKWSFYFPFGCVEMTWLYAITTIYKPIERGYQVIQRRLFTILFWKRCLFICLALPSFVHSMPGCPGSTGIYLLGIFSKTQIWLRAVISGDRSISNSDLQLHETSFAYHHQVTIVSCM